MCPLAGSPKLLVGVRHYASGEETSSFIGARAAEAALVDGGLQFSDMDNMVEPVCSR
ncbi:hypothetical protein [Paenibacillus xylanilyticus]|uniref:hypothetical protein n=1 Tax=Paenibacillus xylanilyticus TaxID=248903 RepID=UPI001586AECB|nr:hypothetical protein [Paenibacillus xylanilyticus]